MKTCIITGTSKGLGEALARAFLFSSYKVIGISRSPNQQLEEEAKQKGWNYSHLSWDLTQLDSLLECIQQCVDLLPAQTEEITIIFNAGIMTGIKKIHTLTKEEVIESFTLNTLSPILCTIHFLQELSKKRSPSIPISFVFISSISASQPKKQWAIYGSSKAAIDNFAQSLALEYAKQSLRLRTLIIYPPAMDTEMRRDYLLRRSLFSRILDWISVHILRHKKVYPPDIVAWRIFHIIETKKYTSGSIWKWV